MEAAEQGLAAGWLWKIKNLAFAPWKDKEFVCIRDFERDPAKSSQESPVPMNKFIKDHRIAEARTSSISLPRHPEASQIPVNGHSFKRKIIWSALGQGLSSTEGRGEGFLHRCWPEETRSSALLGVLQLGARDGREQGTASGPRHGALQWDRGSSSHCAMSSTAGAWGRAGVSGSASGVLVTRSGEIKEKESLGMDLRKGAGWEDTCELFLPPPRGSPDKAAAE